MAGTIVETPINGASDWTDFIAQVAAMKLGFNTIVLDELTTTSEPKIQSGSWVEIKGTIYKFTAEEDITGWAGIGNNTECYIKLIPDGDSVTAAFTTDVPTYTPSSGGWYDGDDRYVAGVRRGASSAVYSNKWLYGSKLGEFGAARTYGTGVVVFDNNILANLTGNVTGDVTGDLTGNVAGNVTGNLAGNVTGGTVAGTTGSFSSTVSGVAGSFSGAVSGTTGTFSGAVSGTTGTFTSNLTVGGDTQLDASPSYGTAVITAGNAWMPARGVYMWGYTGSGNAQIEIKDTGASWFGVGDGAGGCLIADGESVRVYNDDGSQSITIHFRKF